jgi:DNA polymerase-1
MTARKPKGQGAPVLCLIDGSALAFRSYYAFIRRPLLNSRGKNVSAVYGFASSLIKILEDIEPDYIVVAFDTPEPTFRHEEYEDYKATREAPPDELIEQFPAIEELVETFGIPSIAMPGYEADDVIGTLATRARAEGVSSVVVSGDKDFFQLVGDGITVFDPGKDITYTPATVEERFGVPPVKVTEVLGLMGDASDNVPGVPGIGKKTAVALISEYGTIEEVLAHLDDISGPKRRKSLEEFAQQALDSRGLVTIHVDAPVELNLPDLVREPPDVERVSSFLTEYEFPSLVKRVVPLSARTGDTAGFRLVDTKKGLDALVRELESSGGFAVDLETTSLDPILAEVVGVAVATGKRDAAYVPVAREGGAGDGDRGLPSERVLGALRGVLEDSDLPKYGQNLKYDHEVLRSYGITLAPIAFDTMIASYLIDPGKRQHNLAALALEHLGRRMTSIEDLIGKGSDQLSFADVSIDAARDYACDDAATAFELTELFRESVREAGLEELMSEVELPLVPVLAGMELAGVALDVPFVEALGDKLGREIDALRAKVCKSAGADFNLDSPKQVGEVLFEKLKLPKGRRTKTGYSTDIRVLERLRETHEVPGLLLSYRQLMKLKAGYLDALPKLVNPKTGRLHTSFNQTVASTGRLSSSNPNLQNIPVRTEIGREIRRAFVAEEGRVLVSADYSQIELRLMAHLSGDDALIAAFRAGKDVHRSTAALIFGKDEEKVSLGERDWAKTVNFGIMYGMSAFGLARQLEIGNDEAVEFIERYFGMYPGVRDYTEQVTDEAARSGYATTILGRRRPVSGLDSENARVRTLAERVAVNTPIQGSAADLIKVAMLGIDRRIATGALPCDMVLQVHDELVFEVDETAVDDVIGAVREEMENPDGFDLAVPIVANAAHGANWYEAH